TQLLQGIAYSGLAEVEFMYDPKHARFELLEVNARLWGWHSLASRAGLDLPYLVYADAVGKEAPVGALREDVKWVRLVTDVPTAIQEMLSGRLTVREYLGSVAGEMEFAVFSLRDPLPFLADLLLIPYYGIHRGF
ncbi:MAG: ATP-grasp domain-containing protein, partial [Anaerolineae bacterium]|nr:ATP-grasp domain-containing protein [Anaerolineae bacterium]